LRQDTNLGDRVFAHGCTVQRSKTRSLYRRARAWHEHPRVYLPRTTRFCWDYGSSAYIRESNSWMARSSRAMTQCGDEHRESSTAFVRQSGISDYT